jgi:hypothetical protein
MFQSLRQHFPGVPIKCCVFHWTQAVWRHVQDGGLVTTYRQHQTMYRYIKQLMALPFLPAGHITPTFNALTIRANTPALQQLVQYMERQWINNQLHPVQSWSVYKQQIRTNNDVEGIIIHLTDRFSSAHATK